MRSLWIIARQEYLKFITRKGILFGLVMFPLVIMLAFYIPTLAHKPERTEAITLVDRTGSDQYGAFERALAADQDDQARMALRDYARRYARLDRLRASHPEILASLDATDHDSQARIDFHRLGGPAVILAALHPILKPQSPAFTAPTPRWVLVAPGKLAQVSSPRFAATAEAALDEDRPMPLRYIVVVPQHFGIATGQSATIEVWRTQPANDDFLSLVEDTFSRRAWVDLVGNGANDRQLEFTLGRLPNVVERGLAPAARGNDLIRRIVPGAVAYLLIISVIMNAGIMLAGVMEEKSNRVVELILSCVTPRRFMAAKLIAAVGTTMTIALFLGTMITAIVLLLVPGGRAIIGSLGELQAYQYLAMALYFVSALLIYCAIYLGIGSMMSTPQDAQSFMGPLAMIMLLPFMFGSVLVADPNGTIASVLSWIPIYTPFVMMFRLFWDPPWFDLIGTALLTAATCVLLIRQMGRVFAANILTVNKPPNAVSLFRRLVSIRE
jgi:ABC-2 type transport system permease protein